MSRAVHDKKLNCTKKGLKFVKRTENSQNQNLILSHRFLRKTLVEQLRNCLKLTGKSKISTPQEKIFLIENAI